MESFTQDEVAYLETVMANLERAQVIYESYRLHLSQKYDLTADDRFSRGGLITRATPKEPG